VVFVLFLCEISGWKSRDSVPKLVKQTTDGTLTLDSFVSHKMPFEQINDAFDLLHAGKW
jgi:S-(hydroxymethyl)glutathione dehydrogenase/alcohol dehydrogenase